MVERKRSEILGVRVTGNKQERKWLEGRKNLVPST